MVQKMSKEKCGEGNVERSKGKERQRDTVRWDKVLVYLTVETKMRIMQSVRSSYHW